VIGVIGGSGLYSLLADARKVACTTPYGPPSDPPTVGEIDGVPVAFVPRHGIDHRFPPHMVNYRANVRALFDLGVRRIVAPTAAGSLVRELPPGAIAVPDQLVDRTTGREATYATGPGSCGVAFDRPYCSRMRRAALASLRALGIAPRDGGTVVVVQGPRFSTRAESRWYAASGFTIVNMTQYPEAVLARELGMCYVNVSLITDYDVGFAGDEAIAPVTMASAIEVLGRNNDLVRRAVRGIAAAAPEGECECVRPDATPRLRRLAAPSHPAHARP